MIQLITSTGFGDSGSSAITDILREYDCIDTKSSEWECTFLHEADGLADLEDSIREGHRLKIDLAAARFLELSKVLSKQADYKALFNGKFYEISKEFIDSLFGVKWNGGWHRRDSEKNSYSFVEKMRIACAEGFYNAKSSKFTLYENYGWHPTYRYYNEMRYETDIEHFFKCAKTYTSRLVEAMNCQKNLLCIDQLLPPTSIEKYLRYFEIAPKVFVVDKDPRDLYITNQLFNASRYIPSADVDVFIKWYRKTRSKSRENRKEQNICFLKLDELCNDYENQLTKIEAFLGLPKGSHTKNLSYFEPEKSRTNTQIYRRYTNYSAEISKIEKELEEFLYTDCVIPCEKPFEHENPQIEIVKQCDEIQKGKKLRSIGDRFISAFYGTKFCVQMKRFSLRKTFKSKCIGLVKLGIGFILLVPEFFVNIAVL